jgi:hypothetical protein
VYFYVTIIYYIMYVAITCCIMTCSISKGFVTYHGSTECEINYNYNYYKTESISISKFSVWQWT